MIQFLLNDQLVNVEHERADLTLLNFLREHRALTGTKEGCASGDCGACTIAVVELDDSAPNSETLRYKAINSCVTFLSALHGKQIVTVEHLQRGKSLHPLQQAMVDANGTQCGFCTPGFIMSLFALYEENQQAKTQSKAPQSVDRAQVIKTLSGNLCRCTGYQPIINAALQACNSVASDTVFDTAKTAQVLRNIERETSANTEHLFLPKTREQLAANMRDNPDAYLVAGSTDLALLHTQQLQPLPKLISLSYVPELKAIEVNNGILSIGAACTLSEIEPILLKRFPSLDEVLERFASVPIRNQATLGGNIANASPIGDMPPALIALNAVLVLDNGENTREIALKEFFLAYKKTALAANEWVKCIQIPLLKDNQQLAVYKISKRIEDDISAVCTAFNLTLDDGKVTQLSTGFGGVAACPSFAEELESAIVGKTWGDEECVALGQNILFEAFTPIDDVRASAEYRKLMLKNLWYRFWLESNQSSSAQVQQGNTNGAEKYDDKQIPIRLVHHA